MFNCIFLFGPAGAVIARFCGAALYSCTWALPVACGSVAGGERPVASKLVELPQGVHKH